MEPQPSETVLALACCFSGNGTSKFRPCLAPTCITLLRLLPRPYVIFHFCVEYSFLLMLEPVYTPATHPTRHR